MTLLPSLRVHPAGAPRGGRRHPRSRRARGGPGPPRAGGIRACRRDAAAARQPRLPDGPVRPGDQLVRRLHHQHRHAAAGARPDGIGPCDGGGRRPDDPARPHRRAACGRLRGPLGPAPDDVRRRPRPVRAHRPRPDLRLARRSDARRHLRRHLSDERPARPVAGRLHRGRARPRRACRGPARERDLRGGVQHRLDRGSGAGRVPRGGHRAGRDDRDRRPHVPHLRRRDAAGTTPAACRGPIPGDAHPHRHPRGRRLCARPAHPARLHRAVDDDVGDLDRPHHGDDLLHHDRPRAQLRGRRHGAVRVRARGHARVGGRRAARVPARRAS